MKDLSNRWTFEQRSKESKKTSHVVILGNYMPETEKQLPRPGGAGLIYSRNKKKDQYFQKCGGVRESEIENREVLKGKPCSAWFSQAMVRMLYQVI